MMARKLTTLCSISALALLTACSSTPMRNDRYSSTPVAAPVATAPASAYGSQYGRVASIEVIPAQQHSSAGAAVLGAVIGGVIGNQVGSGTGRAAATGLGAVGGAVVGDQIAKRNNGSETDVYRVSVRFDDGSVAQFDYQRIDDLRIGDRVKTEGGQLYRV